MGHGLPDFVDGGMFDNEPIRGAVRLAREADGESPDEDHDEAPLRPTAKRLFGMIQGEAAANDWLKSQRLNNQIAWRDELLDQLVEMVERNDLARPDLLRSQLRGRAESIVDEKPGSTWISSTATRWTSARPP